MPNIATVLKEEISRLARKEIRSNTEAMKKASSQHRRDIAALKRQVAELERQVAGLQTGLSKEDAAKDVAPANDVRIRFTPKGLRSQRKRVGLSAAQYSKLLGVTPQSVYNWERGVSRPRASQLAELAALRGIGKKAVAAKLAKIKA
ncbi:MAG: helix-turn-helix domain-containing protein [Verrucomicrobia bacterium]|jgi:DNA-binding transcriptional regulator YiaG|nr:helix-turn-helix domain-containing protein [Verrucomicrobiota bacterium]